jgi:hypothetical protein
MAERLQNLINQPDFAITAAGEISMEFRARDIFTFQQAALLVRQIPYGRNKDKHNLVSLFADHCGTCSTKHALLKTLADEHNFSQIRLFIGLFRMSAKNTPKVGTTLRRHKLAYIPEAHCYLKYEGRILDFTKTSAMPADFSLDLIEEIEISPEQICDYKVNYHKNYLSAWLAVNDHLHLTPDELWEIREQCIQDLAKAGR